MKRKAQHLRHTSTTRGGLRANGIPEERDRIKCQSTPPAPGSLAERELVVDRKAHAAIIRFFQAVLVKPPGQAEEPEAK